MSGQSFSLPYRDRRHRHRNLIHFRRRTIRRIAIAMTMIGNDHWRCRLRGVILKSDSHGASGRSQARPQQSEERLIPSPMLFTTEPMWQTRTLYDADLHAHNQLKHGSWVLQLVNQPAAVETEWQ